MAKDIIEIAYNHITSANAGCCEADDPNPNKAFAAKQIYIASEHLRKGLKALNQGLDNL